LRRSHEEDVRKAMCIKDGDDQELLERYSRDGYVFHKCYDREHLAKGGIDASLYGITYISPEYMRTNWSDQFQILEHDEGAVSNWQDYVILKRR